MVRLPRLQAKAGGGADRAASVGGVRSQARQCVRAVCDLLCQAPSERAGLTGGMVVFIAPPTAYAVMPHGQWRRLRPCDGRDFWRN